jgi:hypothetical protein
MKPRAAGSEVRIAPLSAESGGRTHRVSVQVDGAQVGFESDDVPLRASPEALGSAFLIPALSQSRRLEIDSPADPAWRANLAPLLRILHRWWRLPRLEPRVSDGEPSARRASATGLCFSGGVDSFHALLCLGSRPDVLVTAQGYDFALDDTTRMSAVRRSLETVAREVGARPVVIRTNLRDHPLMQSAPWERAHGGALAALGHLLDDSIGTLRIASSIQIQKRLHAWGSHYELDRFWSSSRLSVEHVGAEFRRRQKLAALAAHPLPRRHLRVCWQNRSSEGNCSRCEKCLVTMLVLHELGVLDEFEVFEGSDVLVERVNALPRLKERRRTFVEISKSQSVAPAVARAVGRLVERTRRAESLPGRARRLAGRVLARARRSSG